MQYGAIDDTVRILDSTTVELMTTSQYPVLNPEQGLFWYKKYLDGRWIWGHQGWSHGIRARIAYDWNNNTGSVVLTNGEDINSVTQMAVALLNYAAQFGIAELEENDVLSDVMLYQNCPNPFSTSTNVRFTLPAAADVTLKLYNIVGQELITLVSGELQAGKHSVSLDAAGLPNGVYYYRLSSGGKGWTRRCILLK
jgi:hypothetical protein